MTFDMYVGIDYSGAETADSGMKSLQRGRPASPGPSETAAGPTPRATR